jgi:hypothetical protein
MSRWKAAQVEQGGINMEGQKACAEALQGVPVDKYKLAPAL